MKLFRLVPAFGVILLALPTAAHGQSGAIGLGPALPIGPNPDEPEVGWQVSGALEFGPSSSPVAFRLETLVSRIPFRYMPILPATPQALGAVPCPTSGCVRQTAHQTLAAATFDLVIRPSAPATRLVPYLIAGAGVYDHYNTAYGGSNAVGVGVNGGLGLRLPFLHAFVEARAHFIRNAPDCLPITFGLRF
ncbi:MAG: hypothetical protein P8174_02580 [Gemmatimonadota bacterium]